MHWLFRYDLRILKKKIISIHEAYNQIVIYFDLLISIVTLIVLIKRECQMNDRSAEHKQIMDSESCMFWMVIRPCKFLIKSTKWELMAKILEHRLEYSKMKRLWYFFPSSQQDEVELHMCYIGIWYSYCALYTQLHVSLVFFFYLSKSFCKDSFTIKLDSAYQMW